jgi:hypothetical protein
MSTWKEAFERGMNAGGEGDVATAEAAFREAIALAPDETYPHYELGYTLCLAGRYADALRRAEELQRGFFLVETEILMCEQVVSGAIDAQTYAVIRQLMWQTDRGEGTTLQTEQLCRTVIGRAPACPFGYFFLGKAILQQLPDQARTALETCVELGADDTTAVNARFHLAVLRHQAGAADEARTMWKQLGQDFAGHPHAQLACMQGG